VAAAPSATDRDFAAQHRKNVSGPAPVIGNCTTRQRRAQRALRIPATLATRGSAASAAYGPLSIASSATRPALSLCTPQP